MFATGLSVVSPKMVEVATNCCRNNQAIEDHEPNSKDILAFYQGIYSQIELKIDLLL